MIRRYQLRTVLLSLIWTLASSVGEANAETSTNGTAWCSQKVLESIGTGCQVCDSFDPETTVEWFGECKDGRVDGPGELWIYKRKELSWVVQSNTYGSYVDGIFRQSFKLNALSVQYVMDAGTPNEVISDSCNPELRDNSIQMPEIWAGVAAEFPLHTDSGMKYVTQALSEKVNASCDLWLQKEGLQKYKDRIRLEIWMTQEGGDLRELCGYSFQGVRFGKISGCYDNPNPWWFPYSDAVGKRKSQIARVARDEQRAAQEKAKAEFDAYVQSERAKIDADWQAKLDMALSSGAPISNIADFFFYRPGEAMSLFAQGQRFMFTPNSIEFREGKVIVKSQVMRTNIYRALDAMVVERAKSNGEYVVQIFDETAGGEFSVECRFDPQYADKFGNQSPTVVEGKLVNFANGRITLDCEP